MSSSFKNQVDTSITKTSATVPPLPLPAEQQQQQQQHRRFVLFLGPPKTASTSLQRFLSTYANIKSKDFLPAFQGWNYPLFLGSHAGLSSLDNPAKIPTIRKTFHNQAVKYHVNIVAGSEFLASHYRFLGGRLFETLQNWTGGGGSDDHDVVLPLEIVIMMRSPRVDHWISCWKQGSQIKGKDAYGVSFGEMLCNPDYETRLKRIITRTTNPLQIAYETIVEHNLSTTVVDMYGVSKAGFDVSHVFSCEILNVPCVADDTPWVLGLGNTTIHVNSRHGSAELSVEKAQAMEWTFQQRDCAFYTDLAHHPKFRILHRHDDFWAKNCDDLHPKASNFRSDGSTLIRELRNIYQCPKQDVNGPEDPATLSLTTNTNAIEPELHDELVVEENGFSTNSSFHVAAPKGKERSYEAPTGIMVNPTNVTMVIWLALVCLLFVVGLLFRPRRRHGGVPLAGNGSVASNNDYENDDIPTKS